MASVHDLRLIYRADKIVCRVFLCYNLVTIVDIYILRES